MASQPNTANTIPQSDPEATFPDPNDMSEADLTKLLERIIGVTLTTSAEEAEEAEAEPEATEIPKTPPLTIFESSLKKFWSTDGITPTDDHVRNAARESAYSWRAANGFMAEYFKQMATQFVNVEEMKLEKPTPDSIHYPEYVAKSLTLQKKKLDDFAIVTRVRTRNNGLLMKKHELYDDETPLSQVNNGTFIELCNEQISLTLKDVFLGIYPAPNDPQRIFHEEIAKTKLCVLKE
jgi:hypothetical protein